MAISDQFVFTDPVAAQQAVQMFQLEQAGRDAMRRNNLENLRLIEQRNIERDRTSRQDAITQSQLAQRDRELAQSQRQFDITQDYRNRALSTDEALRRADISAGREIAQTEGRDRRDYELFSNLQREISAGEPPTQTELDAISVDLSPQRRDALKRLRQSRVDSLNQQADVAENAAARWNSRMSSIKPDDKYGRDEVFKDFDRSRDKNFIEIDPATNLFRSLIRRPRQDPVAGRSNPVSGPISIGELRNRVRGLVGAAPSGAVAPSPGASAPTASAIMLESHGGFTPRETDFMVPNGRIIPQSEILGATPAAAAQPAPAMAPRVVPIPSPGFQPAETNFEVPVGRVVPQSEILRLATPVVAPAPGRGMGDVRQADMELNRAPDVQAIISNLPGAFYFDLPGSDYYLTPPQRAELARWIGANPTAPYSRMLAVLQAIRSEQ